MNSTDDRVEVFHRLHESGTSSCRTPGMRAALNSWSN